jgi:hypothetical protein
MTAMRRIAAVAGLAFAIAIGGAACAQLAGIDSTNGEGLPGNSIAVRRMSIGKTVDLAPLDLTGLQASYLVAKTAGANDFDRVPASNGGAGMWVTKLRTPAPVVFTLPDDPAPRLYAFPNRALSILYSQLEHPGRAPAPADAMLSVTAHLDAPTVATDSFQIYTVGSWTSHPLPPGMEGSMDVALSYPFDESTHVSGRAQLDRLTAQDVFLILRYSSAALTGVAEAAPFEQTGTDTVTATMTAVAQDRTLDVTISPDITKRYLTVRPAVGTLTMGWNVVAAPGAAIASNAGPVLHSGGLTPSDVGVNVMYGNPFAGLPHNWSSIFTLTTFESRTFTPTPDVIVTLYAGMSQYVEPSPGLKLNLDAGLPELISINGQSLSTDGLTVPRPTAFVEVEIFANPKANTLFGLQLYDLLPSADQKQLDYHFVFEVLGTESTFHLPPEIFQAGHTYTLRALCTAGGFPAIASGDLVTRRLPLSQSYLDSGVFTVMP